ncbi:hypothetical protein AURDEDRAFT_130387 [Auricularia subglabra TFB-10046 SS5]|nr:hypothetical protein AURDEDRAFT_130387 [Auricularia subglabra TFB-10046 SS5]
MDTTCPSPEIHPYYDVQDVPDDIALSSDADLDSMMKAIINDSQELKILREQRDALPPPHEIARLAARISVSVPRRVPGVVAGVRRGGFVGQGTFLLHHTPTPDRPTTYSAVVTARFSASPSRNWLTYDGLVLKDHIADFRAGLVELDNLVPENAFAISVAGWSQLGYLYIEKVESLQAQYDTSKPIWHKKKCVFLTRNALQGAKDAFGTADRLEFILTHPPA